MAQPTSTVRPVVLVVDDDADVRDTTAHLLTTRGMQTRTAADTASALELLEECAGRVGVVVADLSMPGEAPGALTRAIAAADSHIRIVYATGIPRHVAVSTGLVRPDAPYLEKPVDPDTLAGLVRSLTTRRSSPFSA